MVWLGRRIRTRGFELATYLITVAAAATAVMAMLTGLQARATVSRDALLADLMEEHLTNGVAVKQTLLKISFLLLKHGRES
jgi:hypothetical protein